MTRIRALVRVVAQGEDFTEVVFPGWDRAQPVPLLRSTLPDWVSSAPVGARFHAKVWLGTERPSELEPSDWERS